MAKTIDGSAAGGLGGSRIAEQPGGGPQATTPQNAAQAAGGKKKLEDAQRLAQQSGFHRDLSGKARLDLGPTGRQPLPLDPQDIDPALSMSDHLEAIGTHFTLTQSMLARLRDLIRGGKLPDAAGGGPANLAQALLLAALPLWRGKKGRAGVKEEAAPSQEDHQVDEPNELEIQILQKLADAAAPNVPGDLQDLAAHVQEFFGLQLQSAGSVNAQMALASLLVSGQNNTLQALTADGFDDGACAAGMAQIMENAKQAMQQYEAMQHGIDDKRQVLRTLIIKKP